MGKKLPGDFANARTWEIEGEIAYREGQRPIPPGCIWDKITESKAWGTGYIKARIRAEGPNYDGRQVDRKKRIK